MAVSESRRAKRGGEEGGVVVVVLVVLRWRLQGGWSFREGRILAGLGGRSCLRGYGDQRGGGVSQRKRASNIYDCHEELHALEFTPSSDL